MNSVPIYTKVPLLRYIELIDYYDEFKDYYPNCEMETKEWIVKNFEEDWVTIDCGANIGYFSILFAKLSPKGKVYAFEPTDTITKLINNLKHNNIKNVIPIKTALSNFCGNKEDKIYKIWGREPETHIWTFTTIDEFVFEKKIEKIDCIKIDVDSYDFEVIQGAIKTIERFNPFIIIELNHALALRGVNIYKVFRWLIINGYSQGLVLDNDNILLKKNYNIKINNENNFSLVYYK